MPASTQPERRLIMFVDMESYSRNNDVGQFHAQSNFRKIMEAAAGLCGLDRTWWEIQASGDGEFVIFPPGTSEPKVVAELVPAIDRFLRDHNRHAASHAQIRMRVAIHQGLVTRAQNGYAGNAVVTGARLVDAEPVREALKLFPEAGVALIVSADIYRDVVSQSYSGIRSDRYRRVQVRVKSFTDEAWVFVPDEDLNRHMKSPSTDARTHSREHSPADFDNAQQMTGSRFSFGTVTNNGPTVFGDHARLYGHQSARPSDVRGERA